MHRSYDVIVTFSSELPETVAVKNEPYELQAISCDASSAKQYPAFMETFKEYL